MEENTHTFIEDNSVEKGNQFVPTLIGEVSPGKIEEWKKNYPDGIYAVTVKGRIGYFRNPNLTHMNCALAQANKNEAMKKWLTLAEVTWLGGCDELLTSDWLFLSIVDHIQKVSDGEESTLVNL